MVPALFRFGLAALVATLLSAGSVYGQLSGLNASDQEDDMPPASLGPGTERAPLPPHGPFAPGEAEAWPSEAEAPSKPDARPAIDTSPSAGEVLPAGDTRGAERRSRVAVDSSSVRPLPDYDGRGEPTTVGDVLIWVPRVLLSPLYFVSESVVRRPLGWLVTTAEREKWPAIVIDFFTFGPERQAGVIPTGIIDFGFRPSVGLYFFWNDFAVDDNFLRLRAATGGQGWWLAKGIDRYELGGGHSVYLSGELNLRPDWVFHGIGPESPDDEARFGKRLVQVQLGHEADLWRATRFEASIALRDVQYDASRTCCGDGSLAEAVAEGRLGIPSALESGFSAVRHGMTATLDTRPERKPQQAEPGEDSVLPPGAGAKLEFRAEHNVGVRRFELAETAQRFDHWVKYGVTLGGFMDAGGQRVLGLQTLVDFAEPLARDGRIPFTELVSLGGERPLRGFLEGRLLGRSSATARLSYTWPVWVWLDGALHYSVGNVFGEQLEGFELNLLRSSFGLGLRSIASRDHAFEVLIAAGSRTFDEGGGIENVRFVFGATSGF